MTAQRIFVFGASGHAKVVLDAARLQGLEVAAIFDDNAALHGQSVMERRVLGGRDAIEGWCKTNAVTAGIVAIGSNRLRAEVAGYLLRSGLQLSSVVHPQAIVTDSVRIGPGTVVLAGVVLNADARLGRNVIVNTSASVDHDCSVGDHVHIAPGCRLCGGVSIGEGSLLGAGAVVIPGIRIGRQVTVGAGSIVLQDVPDGACVVGAPARPLDRNRQ